MSIESSHDSQPAQNSGAGTDVSRQNVQPFAAQALARSRLISDIAKVSLKKDVSDNRQRRWSLNDWAVALGTLRVQNSQWLHIDSCCGLGYGWVIRKPRPLIQTDPEPAPASSDSQLASLPIPWPTPISMSVSQTCVARWSVHKKTAVKCPETVCVFSIIFMYF